MRTSLRPWAFAAALLLARPASAANTPEASAADAAMGKRIAETVQASIAAANALLKTPHEPPKANTFFALQRKESWIVCIGWLEPDGSKFTPAYVLSSPRAHPEAMARVAPAAAPTEVLPYARAVSASRAAAAQATQNPHMDPVLVVQPDGIDVYVIQGGARPGVLLLGGDFLDHWDKTGTRLRSRVLLHKSVLTVPQEDAAHPGAHVVGSYHTHLIDEGPTATDIAAVLLHPALAPMFVVGRSGRAYRVDEGGVVHLEPRFDASVATQLTPPGPPAGPDGQDVPGPERVDAGSANTGAVHQ